MTFKVDLSNFKRDIDKIYGQLKADPEVGRTLYNVGRDMMNEARRKAPYEQGNLKNSAVVGQARKLSSFRWQQYNRFTARYANIQNTGFKRKVLKPKRAKALFIPLNERARRMGPDRSIRNLVNGVDYIFRKRVYTPPIRRGSARGPNRFLSDTVRKWVDQGIIQRKISSRFDNWLKKFNRA